MRASYLNVERSRASELVDKVVTVRSHTLNFSAQVMLIYYAKCELQPVNLDCRLNLRFLEHYLRLLSAESKSPCRSVSVLDLIVTVRLFL
jgi:hypothetical protein